MKKFIPLLLASAFILQPAYAQTETPKEPAQAEEAPAKPVYSPILPVKIKPRQGGADAMSKAAADVEQENALDPDSLGIYTRVSDGGLGSDVWKNYTSTQLADDLSKLNLNISSPTFTTLLQRVLLTAPDPQSFVEDKTKNEAFSSRLNTLVDLGAFDETVILYKKLEGNIPSAKAALAGGESIVSTGQMGLACLEEKAISPDLKETSSTSFWPDLNTFCKILLTTDTPAEEDDKAALTKTASVFSSGKKLTTPTALLELNGKSVIEILAMKKAGLIPDNLFSPETVKTLKPEIISLLLKQGPSAPAEKLSLMAIAAERGMITREQFETDFVTQSKLRMMVTGYWQPIFALYGKAQTAVSDADKAIPLKESLKTIGSTQNAAMIPFARLFALLKTTDSFTPQESREVVSLLIRSKINVSGPWFAQAFGKPDTKTKESVTDLEVISALQEVTDSEKSDKKLENSEKTDKKPENIENTEKTKQNPENPQVYAVSLILENQESEDKLPESSYEKLFSLTPSTDYVMPSKELMNNLVQASSRQDTGKVILYSLQALNGQRVSQIHPAALFRISEGLRSVGLSEENRSLAHEVLADLIEH